MKTLKGFNLKEKRVLVRCDFNVPLSERGEILDDFRIKETIPTIEYLIDKGAKAILMSHLGRPGEIKDEKLKIKKCGLKPIAERLEKLLGKKVIFLSDCIGEAVGKEIEKAKPGEIILLENLRFHQGEEEGDLSFAKELAKLGDIYVNDAFGASHRSHASIVGVPKYLPGAGGLLLEKEIRTLSKLMENSEKPLIAIMGGAKVETKAKLINKISKVADLVLIGGLIDRELKEKKIILEHPQKIIAPLDEIEGKDIGPETVEFFKEKITSAGTVFFNGVLGIVETEKYAKGTEEILKAIAGSKALSVLGGGDMTQVITKLGLKDKFSHISTGGGAMLEFLSGEKLSGLEALNYGN